MSEVDNGAGGAPESASGGQTQEQKDQVSYETHRKLLAEKKNLQAKIAEFEAAQKSQEQQQLEQQGKLKELNDALKKEADLLKKAQKDMAVKYGSKVLTQEIKSVAKSLGANEKALDMIVKSGDWSAVEISDDFEVKTESIKDALVAMQKDLPELFKTSKAAPNDLPINGIKKGAFSSSIDMSKMKPDDYKKLLAMKLAK